jgi:hypothetical protein
MISPMGYRVVHAAEEQRGVAGEAEGVVPVVDPGERGQRGGAVRKDRRRDCGRMVD